MKFSNHRKVKYTEDYRIINSKNNRSLFHFLKFISFIKIFNIFAMVILIKKA
jgi:hypothetical protein